MALQKCPKCELNYIKEGETYCGVCRRSMNLKAAKEEPEQNLCNECGEHTALKGQDLCAYCYSDKRRREKLEKMMEKPSNLSLEMDELDEVDVDISGDDIPSEDLKEIHQEFQDDEDEDEDDEENPEGESDEDFPYYYSENK